MFDFLEPINWHCDIGHFDKNDSDGHQDETSEVEGSLSTHVPASSEHDVTFDTRTGFESPSLYLDSATVPNYSLTPSDSSGENFNQDPLSTPEASKTPSSTNSSPPYDRGRSVLSPSSNKPGSPPRPDTKICELCDRQFNGSGPLV